MPVALVSFDVDHFKPVNDSLGHDKGDAVLAGLGDLLRSRARGSDQAFRVGGDEFIVLLHNTNERQAAEFAEQFRRELEQTALLPDRAVTISIGVSGLHEGMDVDAWMKACDEKMYKAKKGGRNRVVA